MGNLGNLENNITIMLPEIRTGREQIQPDWVPKIRTWNFSQTLLLLTKKGEYIGLKNLNRLRQGLDSAWNLKMEW